MCLFVWFCFALFCPGFGVSSVRSAFSGLLLPRPGGSPFAAGAAPFFHARATFATVGQHPYSQPGALPFAAGHPSTAAGRLCAIFFRRGPFFFRPALAFRRPDGFRGAADARSPKIRNRRQYRLQSTIIQRLADHCAGFSVGLRELNRPFLDRNIRKYFFSCNPPYSVNSPRSDFFSCRFTSSDVYPAPSRYIIFVTAASVVMSRPLTTPMRCSPSPVS